MSIEQSEDLNWIRDDACRDIETAIFFPVTDDGAIAAKRVCATCPVQKPCLKFALFTNQDDGVWGGASEDERRSIRRTGRYPRKPMINPTRK